MPETDEDHCDYCGDPTKLTGVVRDAWQNVEHEDSDVVTEDGHWCWTFTRPKQVRMHELSCGCWRLGEESSPMPETDATQPSPQPAEDLERVLTEIDAASERHEQPMQTMSPQQRLVLKHWPTSRAALAERLELDERIRDVLDVLTGWTATQYSASERIKHATDMLNALLAQPAAGEEGERG